MNNRRESAKEWLKAFCCAFSRVTRFGLDSSDYASGDVMRKSLYFYPLATLFLAVISSILPVMTAMRTDAFQGVILLTSILYLFLLEWLSRFSNFRDFCTSCDALSRWDRPMEERLAAFSKDAPLTAASVACGSLLMAAKVVALYLIFLRTAIFGHLLYLSFILVVTPFAARCTALFIPLFAKRIHVIYPIILTGLLIFVCIKMLGLMACFGEFISFRSWDVTVLNLQRISEAIRQNEMLSRRVMQRGIGDAQFLIAAGVLSCLYWIRAAKKQLGSLPPQIMGALYETAEFAMLAAFVILADNRIF